MKTVLLVAAMNAALLLIGTAYAQCDITQKVCALADNFDPDPTPPNNPDNQSPTCAPGPVSTTAIKNAFDVAPDGIKKSLCQLRQIFLFSGWHSWGRFNDPTKHSGGNPNDFPGASYIAVAQPVITMTFSQVQDDHLKSINSNLPHIFHSETSNDPKYGLLYVLTHELGHIIWHKQYPLSQPWPEIPCLDSDFGPSWTNLNVAKGRRWTKFDDESFGNHPHIEKPKNATEGEIQDIYTDGFATALAATNPEEDFVETYSLQAVFSSNCPGCVFNINFPMPPSPFQLNGSRPALASKNRCANMAIATLHP